MFDVCVDNLYLKITVSTLQSFMTTLHCQHAVGQYAVAVTLMSCDHVQLCTHLHLLYEHPVHEAVH